MWVMSVVSRWSGHSSPLVVVMIAIMSMTDIMMVFRSVRRSAVMPWWCSLARSSVGILWYGGLIF